MTFSTPMVKAHGRGPVGVSTTTYATIEAAREALLTHICRKAPGLRLNPRHCDIRRAKAKGAAAGGNPSAVGYSPYWICRGCAGPVLPGDGSMAVVTREDIPCDVGASTPVKLCRYKGHKGGFLPLNDDHFHKDTRSRDGHGSYCKVCANTISLDSWHKKKGGKSQQ